MIRPINYWRDVFEVMKTVGLWIIIAGLLMLITGCESFQPRVEHRILNGVKIVDHIDTDDAPPECGTRIEWSGCHKKIGDERHIWRSSLVWQYTIDHEDGHGLGMTHTSWPEFVDFAGRKCVLVLVSGGKYQAGQMICISHRGEEVFTDSRFTELVKGPR